MNTRLVLALSLVVLLAPVIGISVAQQQVYGWQMMSEQEREEHRRMMRSFKTEQEREQYRLEHHKRMQERARERGVSLPDMPLQRGQGGGQGGGPGKGGGGGRW